jgi:hypothetical protein
VNGQIYAVATLLKGKEPTAVGGWMGVVTDMDDMDDMEKRTF